MDRATEGGVLGAKRVMLVDGDGDSRSVYRIVLQHHGYEVEETDDGARALAFAHRCGAGSRGSCAVAGGRAALSSMARRHGRARRDQARRRQHLAEIGERLAGLGDEIAGADQLALAVPRHLPCEMERAAAILLDGKSLA